MAKQFWEIFESMQKVRDDADALREFNASVMIENDMGYWNLKIVYSDDHFIFTHDYMHLEDLAEFLCAALIGAKIAAGKEV